MAPHGKMFILNFVKIGQLAQTFEGEIHKSTYKEAHDFISLSFRKKGKQDKGIRGLEAVV
jgi:hypothetical protein